MAHAISVRTTVSCTGAPLFLKPSVILPNLRSRSWDVGWGRQWNLRLGFRGLQVFGLWVRVLAGVSCSGS